MFQEVPESTPNMRGFAPFWFRQIRGHSLHYNTQDVWFSASFEEISKQLTGNPPTCKTQICTKLIRVVVHLPQWFSGKNRWSKNFDWERSQNASLKAISTLDKNYLLESEVEKKSMVLKSFKLVKNDPNTRRKIRSRNSGEKKGILRGWRGVIPIPIRPDLLLKEQNRLKNFGDIIEKRRKSWKIEFLRKIRSYRWGCKASFHRKTNWQAFIFHQKKSFKQHTSEIGGSRRNCMVSWRGMTPISFWIALWDHIQDCYKSEKSVKSQEKCTFVREDKSGMSGTFRFHSYVVDFRKCEGNLRKTYYCIGQ